MNGAQSLLCLRLHLLSAASGTCRSVRPEPDRRKGRHDGKARGCRYLSRPARARLFAL